MQETLTMQSAGAVAIDAPTVPAASISPTASAALTSHGAHPPRRLPLESTSRSSLGWLAYVLAGLAFIALYFVVAGGSSHTERLAKVSIYSGLSLSALVALVVGLVRHRPAYRTPWLLLVLSQLIYFAADSSFYVRHDLLGLEAFPSVSDLLYLGHYPVLLAALALFIRRRTPGRDLASLLDAGIITLGAGLLSWVFLVDPNVDMPGVSGLVRIGALYQPLMDVPVLALALRLMLGSDSEPPRFTCWSAT